MPMTDAQGNPIPEDDPRLPTREATLALRDQADTIKTRLENLGTPLGPLVEIEATLKALEGLLVNPDPDSAVRRLFEHRLQTARVEVLGEVAKMVHDAKKAAEPRLEVASTVDVLRVNG